MLFQHYSIFATFKIFKICNIYLVISCLVFLCQITAQVQTSLCIIVKIRNVFFIVSISINLFGDNHKQTSNHDIENKPHYNTIYFVPRTSEITIQFSSQMP